MPGRAAIAGLHSSLPLLKIRYTSLAISDLRLMATSEGLPLIWRLFLLCQWRRCPTTNRRLKSYRSPPEDTKLLRWVFSLFGGGEEEKPSLPPKGHLVVYVGGGEKEKGTPQRYFVPVIYFNHPLFDELLREAEKEFGFHHPAGIRLTCPVSRFELVTTRIADAIYRRTDRRILDIS